MLDEALPLPADILRDRSQLTGAEQGAANLRARDLAVLDVHQEHGILCARRGLDAIDPLPFADWPVGSRVLATLTSTLIAEKPSALAAMYSTPRDGFTRAS